MISKAKKKHIYTKKNINITDKRQQFGCGYAKIFFNAQQSFFFIFLLSFFFFAFFPLLFLNNSELT